jgi:hypothetical protein
VGVSVKVGSVVLVDIVVAVGVLLSVFDAVGVDVFVAVGVLEGAPTPGAEFFGAFVGFGVADGGTGTLVGKFLGIPVGFAVAT